MGRLYLPVCLLARVLRQVSCGKPSAGARTAGEPRLAFPTGTSPASPSLPPLSRTGGAAARPRSAARGRSDHAPHVLVPPAVRRPARRARLGGEAWEAHQRPAVFMVNTRVDENNGLGVGHVSLREATAEANARPGADAIPFSVTGAIRLGGTLPDLSTDSASTGPGLTGSRSAATATSPTCPTTGRPRPEAVCTSSPRSRWTRWVERPAKASNTQVLSGEFSVRTFGFVRRVVAQPARSPTLWPLAATTYLLVPYGDPEQNRLPEQGRQECHFPPFGHRATPPLSLKGTSRARGKRPGRFAFGSG